MTDHTPRDSGGKPGQRPTRKTGVSGAEFAGVGLQFAASIVAFMFIGVWLDKKLGTSPWLLLLCVFVGASAGFYSIYRKLMAGQKRPDNEHC